MRELSQAKADALVDRGTTLLLAALDVGPYIKKVRESTGLPINFVQNASWYLRRNRIWYQHDNKVHRVHYSWLSAYHRGLPEGIEGLTRDAETAAGLGGAATPFTIQPASRRGTWKGWAQAPPPPCGTSVALSRHRRNKEPCSECEAAAEQRHASWLERKARIQVQREEWLSERDKATTLQLEDWEGLLAPDKNSSVWATISLDAPLLWGVDGDKTTMYDRVGRSYEKDFRDVHNLEWVDETYDAAEPELTEWLDGRRFIDLSFPEVREEADELVAGFSEGRTFARKDLPHRHKSRNKWS